MNFYSSELNKEFLEPKGRFIFKTYELERQSVVSSSTFNVESNMTMQMNSMTNPNWDETPLNYILFNFFPLKEKSIFIIGFHTTFLKNLEIVNRFKQYTKKQQLKLVSDILIERVESWACSFDFYEKKIKDREKLVISEFKKTPKDFTGRLSNRINLFEFNKN